MRGPSENEEQEREDEILYAGDTSMIIDLDTMPQTAQKLLNYGALIDTRDVKIHWGRVGIIARLKENGALKAGIPNHFNQTNTEESGEVLGKYIHMNLTSGEARQARLYKERQAWKAQRRNPAIVTDKK